MKLIDTSIWIEFFRRKGDPAVKQGLANLIAGGQAAHTCPIRFELLFGALDHEIPDIETGLSFCQRIEVTASDWDLAAEKGRELRQAGITAPSSDLLIAAVALGQKLPIVCRDQHFAMIQKGAMNRLEVETW
jgi:predicted nucleic acid-binding protein